MTGMYSWSSSQRTADVEFEAFFFQQLTAAFGLFDTVFGQVDIGPAGEQVGLVPLGLAVSD